MYSIIHSPEVELNFDDIQQIIAADDASFNQLLSSFLFSSLAPAELATLSDSKLKEVLERFVGRLKSTNAALPATNPEESRQKKMFDYKQ